MEHGFDDSFRCGLSRRPGGPSSMWMRRTHGETVGSTVGTAHREGLRERPCDVPATECENSVPNPARGESRQGEDEEVTLLSAVLAEKSRTIREGAFGHARALVCREC